MGLAGYFKDKSFVNGLSNLFDSEMAKNASTAVLDQIVFADQMLRKFQSHDVFRKISASKMKFYKHHALYHSTVSIFDKGPPDATDSTWVELSHKTELKPLYKMTDKRSIAVKIIKLQKRFRKLKAVKKALLQEDKHEAEAVENQPEDKGIWQPEADEVTTGATAAYFDRDELASWEFGKGTIEGCPSKFDRLPLVEDANLDDLLMETRLYLHAYENGVRGGPPPIESCPKPDGNKVGTLHALHVSPSSVFRFTLQPVGGFPFYQTSLDMVLFGSSDTGQVRIHSLLSASVQTVLSATLAAGCDDPFSRTAKRLGFSICGGESLLSNSVQGRGT